MEVKERGLKAVSVKKCWWNWAGARWAGARWAGARWAGARWAGAGWAGARWAGARWAGVRWAGAKWALQNKKVAVFHPKNVKYFKSPVQESVFGGIECKI